MLTKYNPADHLLTQEEMSAYLSAVIDDSEGDLALVSQALLDIAQAKKMLMQAQIVGLTPETSDFSTVLKVIHLLGFSFSIVTIRAQLIPAGE